MTDSGSSGLLGAGVWKTLCGRRNRGVGARLSNRFRWCALAIAVMAWSCSGVNKEELAIAQMKWDLAPSAIRIHVVSDSDLNLYDGRRHTVLLGVCQTADVNSFLVQLSSQNTIGRLLETGQGAPTMIAGFNRFVISPGQKDTLSMDRAQGSQYVGIVAGYYNLSPTGVSRLFAVPVLMQKKGFISKTVTASPQPLDIDLKLGAMEIASASREAPVLDGGQLVPAPGEQDGMIPISVAGIHQAESVTVPAVVALPHAGGD
jgi:predicted component of type VI protein secretion system